MQLGRVPSIRDARTLWFNNYISIEQLRTAREEIHKDWCAFPMLANDKYPCCASAAAGHMVHHWTELTEDLVLLDEDPIVVAHTALTGGALQQGVSMLDALKYWRKTGIGEHAIHSFVQTRAKDRGDLKCAVHLFGAAYLGLDLPNFAYPPPEPIDVRTIPAIPWEIPATATPEDVEPQASKGHCVAAVGYNERVVYVVTWGTLKTMSWEFFERYTAESYAVLSRDWVSEEMTSPTGFDLGALERDLYLVSTPSPSSGG